MTAIKRIAKAFAVGGAAGIVGQIILMIVNPLVPDPALATMLAMLIFGIISMIIIAAGIYGKIAEFGGEGASIPLCGLMFGAAMACAGAIREGLPTGKAVMKGFVTVITLLGAGYLASFIIGLCLH